jgi:hypothetical protein
MPAGQTSTGPATPPAVESGTPVGRSADSSRELVVAPGYQCALLPGPPGRVVRWRSVRRDGTRFPPVGELGIVIAQARTLARADGAAWIVGSDHHTVEIHSHPADPGASAPGGFAVRGCGPRWTHTVARALTH